MAKVPAELRRVDLDFTQALLQKAGQLFTAENLVFCLQN